MWGLVSMAINTLSGGYKGSLGSVWAKVGTCAQNLFRLIRPLSISSSRTSRRKWWPQMSRSTNPGGTERAGGSW